ncbi:MAG: DUF1572 family protein [Planctomycetota bacterium]
MNGDDYLDDARREFNRLKGLAERAVAQTRVEQFFTTSHASANSLAIQYKHLAGNMRSRWTRFSSEDGEKPDRNRDAEFELAPDDTRERLAAQWEHGWSCLFEALAPLRAADLARVVTIRGEPHTVWSAIQRQLTHYAYHVGQIVQRCRDLVGEDWRSLSIPRGGSVAANADPKPHWRQPPS